MIVKSERLIVRPCVDAAEWDGFLSCIPWATPQHAFVWGQTLASSFGYLQLAYRLFYSQGHVVAALPLMYFSAGGPFRAIYSLSFDSYGGPLIHPEHLDNTKLFSKISDEIDCQAARQGAFEARFVVPPMAPNGLTRFLQSSGRTLTFTRSCPLLDLDRSLKQIVQGYKSSVRRAIRRSVRNGVIVEENVDIGRFRQVYPIYRETLKRIRGTVKPLRFIEALIREELAVPFVASKDGCPIGIVILLVSSRMAIYWISAASLSHSTLRPTNALVDTAIRWCHARGIPIFSFGESPGERPGLVRFKKGWGPTPNESVVMIRTYQPWIRLTWHLLEPMARRVYAIWDQLRTSAPRSNRNDL